MIIKGRSARSNTLYNNILGSGIYKGINVLFNLLIVRYSILLVGEEQYGIWLALLSFLTWFSAFEVGISSSIRNTITALVAEENFQKIKQLIAGAYKSLLACYSFLVFLLLIASLFFPIEKLLLPEGFSGKDFKIIFQLCCFIYFGHFVVFLINSVLLASHRTKYTYLITAVQNGFILAGLLLANYMTFSPSLLLFCLWFSTVPFLVWFLSGLVSFRVLFRNTAPKLKEIASTKPLKVKSLGKSFFIIQLSTLVIYSTDNIILVNLLSGADVAIYNITFKYFNILIVIFNLVLLPYWASFTDAYQKLDFGWISTHLKRLVLVWVSILLLGLGMLSISSFAFNLWIGKELEVDLLLLIFMLFSILLTAWNSIFSYFLNSISKIRFQMKLLVLAAIVNVPLSIYFVKSLGSGGAIIATCISLAPAALFLPLQSRRIMQQMKQQ